MPDRAKLARELISLIGGFLGEVWARLKGLVRVNFRYRSLLGPDYEEYRAKREASNFYRSTVVVFVLLATNLIGLLEFPAHFGSSGLPVPYNQRLHFLYLVNVAFALLSLGLALALGFRSGGPGGGGRAYSRLVLVWIYIIGVVFSLNGQGFHDQILNLFFSLVFVAALFSIPPFFSFLSHAALAASFCLLLGRFQPDFILRTTNIDNTITATVYAFFFSRVIFQAELERFVQGKLILRKNDELRRQKNANRFLTVANERKLTPRELELVKLLLLGKSNKEIAAETLVELATVKKHLSNVFRKCGVGSRVELLLLFGVSEGEDSIAV